MSSSVIVPVKTSSDSHALQVYFEATETSPFEDRDDERRVSRSEFDLDELCGTIGQVAEAVGKGLQSLKAKRTVVEFGVKIGADSGHLTALIVKGTAEANLKVTLEWS